MPSVSLPTLAMGIGLSGEAVGTAATIGAALPSFSTLAAFGSLATSALGSIQAGRQASASAKYNAAVQQNNAAVAKQNATFAGQEGAANAANEQQKTRAAIGSIRASQAANGIDVNKGSAVDVRSSAAELGELNAITIRSNAARQAYGFQTQASSDMAQSKLDKQEAGYDTTAGYMKGATTLLSGGYQGHESGLWNDYLNSSSF